MLVRFTKLSSTNHRFECVRANGSGEVVELETKTFLLHDFLHYILETEAGLKESFYGLLASGRSYVALSGKEAMEQEPTGDEARQTEMIVGSLTGVIKGEVSPLEFLAGMKNIFDASGITPPAWLTVEFVEEIKEKFRRLMGEWNSLHFGGSLERTFPE